MPKNTSRRHAATTTSLFAMVMMGIAHPAFASDGFTRFAGSWRGGGSIMMDDGSHEAIRCKASYAVRPDGETLNIDMNCANDSFRVHILTQVAADGPDFSGSWQETTRQAQGTVTGHVSDSGEMAADLQAMGVAIQLVARTDGRQQAITLRAQGTDVRDVTIRLHR